MEMLQKCCSIVASHNRCFGRAGGSPDLCLIIASAPPAPV
jgi:hypothetical protein